MLARWCSRRFAVLALPGWLAGAGPSGASPAVQRPLSRRSGPLGGLAEAEHAPDIGAQDPSARVLTPQAADDLSDMLTVVMCSLEQLASLPTTRAARLHVERADAATRRAGQLLWHVAGAERSLDPAAPLSPRSIRETGLG